MIFKTWWWFMKKYSSLKNFINMARKTVSQRDLHWKFYFVFSFDELFIYSFIHFRARFSSGKCCGGSIPLVSYKIIFKNCVNNRLDLTLLRSRSETCKHCAVSSIHIILNVDAFLICNTAMWHLILIWPQILRKYKYTNIMNSVFNFKMYSQVELKFSSNYCIAPKSVAMCDAKFLMPSLESASPPQALNDFDASQDQFHIFY